MLSSWKSDPYNTAPSECPKYTLAFWIASIPKIKQKDGGNEGETFCDFLKETRGSTREVRSSSLYSYQFSAKHKISK